MKNVLNEINTVWVHTLVGEYINIILLILFFYAMGTDIIYNPLLLSEPRDMMVTWFGFIGATYFMGTFMLEDVSSSFAPQHEGNDQKNGNGQNTESDGCVRRCDCLPEPSDDSTC